MRLFLKSVGIVPLVLAYLLLSCGIALLPSGARLRRVFLTKNSSFFSRMILSLLGVRIHASHQERMATSGTGRLIVSNHVSYIDVLVLASLMPAVFITSVELGSTPVLGLLARCGGSLFVERRKVAGLKKEIHTIAKTLADGFSAALFPEGTTSNGERVQLFKNSLFTAAVAAKVEILPICLRYTKVNDRAVTRGTRDSVFYYGGMPFFQQFGKLLRLRSVDVEVLSLKSIKVTEQASRKELALEAHAAISSAYSHPVKT